MPKRNIPTNIENLVINNEPFEYAHLVKFERPFDPKNGQFRTDTNRYVYLTDGARDISYDGNIYRAHRLQSVGNYSETTVARATNMSLVLSGEDLGLSFNFRGSLSSSSLTAATSNHVDGSEVIDFVELGFREGDKVKLQLTSGSNFSNGDAHRTYIISSFSNNNQTITLAVTGSDSDDDALANISETNLTISLDNEELSGATLERGTNASDPLFTNREVFVYKIFFDADGVEKGALEIFKGIIASTSISESASASRVKWSLTSHWGDFVEVGGRLTLDEVHRALDADGKPSIDSAIKPIYATDLGFQHSETSLNTIANYKTTETRSIMKSKKRGGIAGAFGGKKYYTVEEEYEVDHEVDLNVHLKGRYLPVVYGVQRVPGIPVFADTKNNNSKEVYVAYALAEGKIQGLYNMYFENSSIICTDLNDSDVRNASNGTNRDSSQLQCYGRADRGDTLSGSSLTGALTTTANSSAYDYTNIQDDFIDGNIEGRSGIITIFDYTNVNEVNTPEAEALSNSKGLQTSETASILNPFNMKFTFYQGSSDQKADNNLVKIAEDNLFKIQNSYYESDQPYWSPNHRLLDTAYAVMKFTIGAEQTTIPEVEYVIRGKVLEAHNYDGTFVHDAVLGASDNATNFKNGDTCNVEVSIDGSTWITIEDDATPFVDGGTDKIFRILHNYSYFNSDGNEETRIRLDSVPNLNYGTDGSAGYTYVRLKSGSNYWHMITHNYGTVSTAASFPNLYKTPTSMSTNSSGVLTATFSSSDATALKANYGSNSFTYNLGGTLTGTALAGLENMVLRGVWSSNTVTFRGTYTASQTITGVTVSTAGVYDLSSNSDVNAVTNAADINFENLEIVETGEQRQIIGFDTTNKYVTLSSPFTQAPTNSNTFTITGRGKDLRASNNPAIQTLDYITSKRYGKGLNTYTDLNLPSFKAAALLCDTRSDVTLKLSSAASCVEGDMYKLVDTDGDHVASGLVQASTSSSTQVTFTRVSGKFLRQYYNYVRYKKGDYVISNSRVYEATTAGYLTKPTHSSGTVSNFKFISSVSLTKVTGSGPSSLSLVSDGTLPIYSLYDSDFIKYWRYLGWESHDQEWVTRHQTNFKLDTSKSIFSNINALLSHYNGILSYSNGKYELNVETQANAETASVSDGVQSNPLHIENEDIIGNISLVDNTQRTSKNTIKASISDPQNNWGSRSVSFFNSNFLKADRNIVKTGTFPFTGITNYYNARINVEKELTQTRFSKEISFTVGQRGLLLKAGEVISITYPPFNFDNKRFRIENLTFNANCTVSIKAREYDDSIYVITPQRASLAHTAQTGANPALEKPSAPTSLTTSSTKPGTIEINWSNASNFSAESDYTELYRHTSDSRSNATLLATIADATTFSDIIGEAGTFYYWVRHKRNSNLTNTNKTLILEGDYNASAGVSGVAKLLSPSLEVDTASIQVKFNDSGVLTPSGSAQDVKVTATLKNITPNGSGVLFSLLDSDQTSQSDVQFTNGNTTLADTSSPYEATVDASTFSSSSTNKFVKVAVTDTSGEAFTSLIPVSVTKDGAAGSPGADGDDGNDGDPGLRTVQGYLFYEKTTSGAPGTPGSTTYRFSTGDIDGGSGATEVLALEDTSAVNKWTNEPRTNDATSSNNFYTIRYSGTETSANSSTVTVSYSSSVVEQTSFTGIVTFNNGTFNNGSDITTIDGDNITTGSIKSSNFSGTGDGSAFSTAGTRINLNNGSIASEQFRIDTSGNANFKGSIFGGSVRADVTNPIPTNIFTRSAPDTNIPVNNENGAFIDLENGKFVFGKADNYLSFDGTTTEMSGTVSANTLLVTDATIVGELTATKLASGTVKVDSLAQEVWNAIGTRTGQTGGYYDSIDTETLGQTGYLGEQEYIKSLNDGGSGYEHEGEDTFLELIMNDAFSAPAGFTGTAIQATAQFQFKLNSASTWTNVGSAMTLTLTSTSGQSAQHYSINFANEVEISSSLTSGNYYDYRVKIVAATGSGVRNAFQQFTNYGQGGANDANGSPIIFEIREGATGVTAGDLVTNRYITHSGDENTRISFTPDQIDFEVGGQNFITLEEDTNDIIRLRKDVIMSGDLTVQGTTTTLNTATLDVEDKNITLNYGSGDTSGSANGAGITIQDAVDVNNNATILWDASGDKFDFSHPISVAGNISVTGTVDGRDIASDGSKLDNIESNATADQTQAEINALGITATGLSGTPNITVGTVQATSFSDGTISGVTFVDEDNMASNSATKIPTQQSVKAYVDSQPGTITGITNFADNRILTASGSTTINGESNLTFNGSTLGVNGAITVTNPTADAPVATFTGNYTSNGDVALSEWQRNGGAVKANFVYVDSTTDMEFGTTTSHGLGIKTGNTRRLTITSAGNATFSGKVTINEGDVADQLVIYRTSPSSNQVGMKFDVHGVHSRFFGVGTDGHPYWSTTANLTGAGNGVWHSGLSNFKVGNVSVLTSSRNLQNIGTISSGSILATVNNYQLRLRRADNADDDWKFYSWESGLNIFPASASSVFFGRDGASTDVSIYNGNLKIGTTTVIDSSRNLTNIGTISTSVAMDSSPTNIIYMAMSGNNTNGGGGAIRFDTSASNGTSTLYYASIEGIRSSTSDGSNELAFFTTKAGVNSNAPTRKMTINQEGKVGIGTDTPDLKLDVSHGTTTEYVATFQNTADNLELKIGTTTGALLNIQGQVISSSAAYNIGLQTDGGNVGIGNSNPSQKLSVSGNISVTGTVDGRDIATDGTKLDGIEAGATADQTQSEINALGITATGLSGTPNITVGTISSGHITTSGALNFTSTTSYVRNQQDASGQIEISALNSSSTARGVRWDAGNDSGGAFRPETTSISSLGLTNRIWDNLFVNTIKIGSSNTTVIDASRNLTNIGSGNFAGDVTLSGGSGKLIYTGMGSLLHANASAFSNVPQHDLLYWGWTSATSDYIYLKAGGNSTGAHGTLVVADGGLFYGVWDNETGAIAASSTNPITTTRFRVDNSGNGTFAGTISSGAITVGAGTNYVGLAISGSNSTYTAATIGNTGSGDAGIFFDASNGDFAGSDYVFIGQKNNLDLEISNNPNGGDIYFKESNIETLRLVNGNATFAGDVYLGNGKEIRLYDADGSAYTGIKAKTATSSSGTYQLPGSLPSNSGAVLISTTAGELSWSSNTVSTYTNGAIASNRVITSNGPSSIEAESNLTFDNTTLHLNHAGGEVKIGASNGVSPKLTFQMASNTASPRIEFNDGSTVAYIQYNHGTIPGDKLTISAPTTEITGDLNLSEYIYHTGDTDTYIRIQDNSWTFRTGGGDRVIIDNSNVQITNNLTLGTPDDHILMRLTDNSGAQFGFDPEYDHHLVITNEQGTTSQAMFLADTGDSGNDIWGVTRTAQGPTSGNTTGNEVWSKVLTLHGNGNLYTTGNIANEQFTIPNTAGSAGQVLKWPSSGTTLEWGAASGGSTTTINNNANNRVITGSGTADTLEAEANFTYDGTNLDVTGNIRATGDVTAFHSSDARLKDNVTIIDSALNKVKQIRGVEFDWNNKQNAHEGHDIGVIAQEVEQVAPELVKDREDGYKAVDYPKLTALLIEAVKELELKVKELEEKQK